MRIAFVGKGGSGKTTLASLFSQYAAKNNSRVLALDADINQHLASALGYTGELKSMGEDIDAIKGYLRGDNPHFTLSSMHKTTPPGLGSHFVTLDEADWFMNRYTAEVDGMYVAGAGAIPSGNVGVRCYHGLNGAIELLLGHMIDRAEDTVVVDMTAGADAFSSSLFAKVDALVLVVEPTMKSLSVYDQFLPYTKEYDIPLLVVGNKILDAEDKQFVEQRVGALVACIGNSLFVRARERGVMIDFNQIDQALESQLAAIFESVSSVPRDWAVLERRSHLLHERSVHSWAGVSVETHIDPHFSLERYARGYLRQVS
ncbi:ATP-binding protein [Candidatus Saccharibacteria bacterium]|nr:ATP-binding protein [Candidatus Saccharibacteria bacterium]MBH1972874.1 ATP-binding protein [Candidatus Saccharibacteria bacterium]MBH1991076.1 ATP-binding protein [Candidatus Saccharibacteria bacterium]